MAEIAIYQSKATPWPALMDHLALQPKDWVGLSSGDKVFLRRRNGILIRGTVEDMASDGSIFWVWTDGGGGRVAVHKDDEVTLWLAEEPKSIQTCASCKPSTPWGVTCQT